MLENIKAFYCAKWKTGCKFNIWHSATKNYQFKLTAANVTSLLAGKAVNAQIVMPDTKEKAMAQVVLDTQSPSVMRFVNLTRMVE